MNEMNRPTRYLTVLKAQGELSLTNRQISLVDTELKNKQKTKEKTGRKI